MSVVSVVRRQVAVTAPGRSLVQRSPTDCGVSECDREAWITGRPSSRGLSSHRVGEGEVFFFSLCCLTRLTNLLTERLLISCDCLADGFGGLIGYLMGWLNIAFAHWLSECLSG